MLALPAHRHSSATQAAQKVRALRRAKLCPHVLVLRNATHIQSQIRNQIPAGHIVKVLIACDFSGIVRDAFAERGRDAWSCDLLPSDRPGPDRWKERSRTLPGIAAAMADRWGKS